MLASVAEVREVISESDVDLSQLYISLYDLMQHKNQLTCDHKMKIMIYLKLRLGRKPFCLIREIKVNYYNLDASFVFFKRPATPCYAQVTCSLGNACCLKLIVCS